MGTPGVKHFNRKTVKLFQLNVVSALVFDQSPQVIPVQHRNVPVSRLCMTFVTSPLFWRHITTTLIIVLQFCLWLLVRCLMC